MALQVDQTNQDTFSVNESGYCYKQMSGKVNKMAISALKGSSDKQESSQGAEEASGSTSDGSLTQLSVGPGALAQLMIYKAMDLYATVISLQSEERTNMVEAQVSCAKSQATETVAEGNANFWAAIESGALTIAGAGLSLVAYHLVDRSINGGSNSDLKELEPKLDQMSSVDKEMPTINTGEDAGDQLGVEQNQNTEQMKKEIDEDKVKGLVQDFKNHDYSRAGENQDETKEAVHRLQEDENYQNWRSEFNNRYERMNKEMNSIVMKQSTVANYSNMASTLANSLCGGSGKMFEGLGQKKSAEHRAAASLDGTSTQMAGGSASEFAQSMSKAYDAQVQEVQMLEKINQANSVNG